MEPQSFPEALAFDDVLLVPQASDVLPGAVDTATRLTARVSLHIPIVSAAMDTVTESRAAIAMAQAGGLGIVHKNMSIDEQVAQVTRVKKFESGMVKEPITLGPDEPLQRAIAMQAACRISGFPITDAEGVLVGILTNRDIRAARGTNQLIRDVMTPREKLLTAHEGVTQQEAMALLHERRVEKLPVIDREGRLRGLVTIKDIEQIRTHPNATKDAEGRLRVGAAIGVGAAGIERALALQAAGADLVCLDTAHGHAEGVIATVAELHALAPDLDIIAGNVSTAAGAAALRDAGVSAVKVGQGPGSICTTRIVSGCGMPQFTAVLECARVLRDGPTTLIADGGIKFSGDLVKACAAGADVVMIGGLLAGTDEAPGEVILYQGRRYKVYRGMGSLSAMAKGSRDRYGQADVQDLGKLVPEGIEGRVSYSGPLAETLYQLVGGLRSGMGYVGAATLGELRAKAQFVRVTAAGFRESHVHDVKITKEAPNYSVE